MSRNNLFVCCGLIIGYLGSSCRVTPAERPNFVFTTSTISVMRTSVHTDRSGTAHPTWTAWHGVVAS